MCDKRNLFSECKVINIVLIDYFDKTFEEKDFFVINFVVFFSDNVEAFAGIISISTLVRFHKNVFLMKYFVNFYFNEEMSALIFIE